MHIPKNFTLGIYSTSVFHNKMWGLKGGFELQRWNDIAAVLVILIKRSCLRNQFSNCFMTEDNLICRASSFLSTTNTSVSSAYRISFAPWIFNGGSFIYILKTKGVPKLSPVVHHMKSPSMKIEICVGCIYFYLFEIFQQIVFCLSSKIETTYSQNL